MSRHLKWTRLLWLVAAGGLLTATFWGTDVDAVRGHLSRIRLLAPLIFLPQILSLASETRGWQLLFEPLGKVPRYERLLSVRLASEAIGRTLPGGGILTESVKPLLLSRHCDVPVHDGVASVAARKVSVMLSHAVVVLAAVVLGASTLGEATSALRLPVPLAGVLALAAVFLVGTATAAVIGFRFGRVAERIHAMLRRLPVVGRRLSSRSEGFCRTDDSCARALAMEPAHALGAGKWFLVGWALEVVETYVLLRLLGVDLGFEEILAVEVVVALARHLFVFLPAGIGVQDAGYVLLLGALGVPDVLAVGAAFVVLKRAKELFWSLVGFGLLPVTLGRWARRAVPARSDDRLQSMPGEVLAESP
jgi:uncharacterized protein (TIRG00374 family)